jgi:hypothetical protein
MQKHLPREIRDIIYMALYAQDKPISLVARKTSVDELPSSQHVHQDPDRGIHGWPEDTAGFLNRDIVGFETSQEAATTFYKSNTFLVHGTHYLYELQEFDHYRSGLIPVHHIQSLILHVEHSPSYRPYDHEFNISRRKAPTNESYVSIQSKDRLRHEMETLFGLLEGHDRPRGTLEIYAHRPTSGLWDLRDSVNHLVNLKLEGLAVTLRVDRCFNFLKPWPTPRTSASEPQWLDFSSYLDKPTEEERQIFKKPHHGWVATEQENTRQHLREQRAPSEALELMFLDRPFDLPCNGPKICRKEGHGDCSDHSWHAGWYRALLHDLAERTLERELNDSDFDSCRFCPDERLVAGLVTKTMQVQLEKADKR